MGYADLTTRDPNPVKRWLHQRRFTDALRILGDRGIGERTRILDVGAGDGELSRRAASRPSVDVVVYEPAPSQMEEARAGLAPLPAVSFAESLESLAPDSFDYVFCLEVFEHLPPPQ